MKEEKKEQEKKTAKLIAKVWSDESFKERLIADPRTVLAAEGLNVPAGVDIKVLEQDEKTIYLIIPHKPSGGIEELEERNAAYLFYCHCH